MSVHLNLPIKHGGHFERIGYAHEGTFQRSIMQNMNCTIPLAETSAKCHSDMLPRIGIHRTGTVFSCDASAALELQAT